MHRFSTPIRLAVAFAPLLSAPRLVPAQGTDLRGNYDTKTGLTSPIPPEEGSDVRIVTTDTVAGTDCDVLESPHNQFPAMVLPTSGLLGGRTLADGAIRGMNTLRDAALADGANAVLGLRREAYLTRNDNPRLFLYGTLARCE